MKTEMQEWQKRVVEEQKELETKIDKLKVFIENDPFDDLPEHAKKDLFDQYDAMRIYCNVLKRRISKFE